jgi:predicted phosphodiesterase
VKRVAVLCDVHGNLPALEAVLADPRLLDAESVVVGGDVVAGPMPRECLDLLLSLGERAHFLRGNADRFVAERSPEHGASWCSDELGDERLAIVAGWPLTVELDVDGLGRVLFVHATLNSDEEILTRITPEDEVAQAFAGVEAGTVIGGHTHVQFDRRIAGGPRFVNAGSVGIPYEGRRGAFWALLGPDVELVSTDYDVESAAAAIRDRGWSESEQVARWLLEPEDPDKVTEFFESARRA